MSCVYIYLIVCIRSNTFASKSGKFQVSKEKSDARSVKGTKFYRSYVYNFWIFDRSDGDQFRGTINSYDGRVHGKSHRGDISQSLRG